MDKNQQLIRIRTKKLGLLIYDARLMTRRTVAECAATMGVSPEKYMEYEGGVSAPSLPELEALAYSLDVPMDHFWGHESLSQKSAQDPAAQSRKLRQLRNRILGTRLSMARSAANLSLTQVSEHTSIPESELKEYEEGRVTIPLPHLDVLSHTLNLRMEDLFDDQGLIGEWRIRQENIQSFLELPANLRVFVSKPVNRPYLELAARLSDLSVEKLRSVAEGLLEITY